MTHRSRPGVPILVAVLLGCAAWPTAVPHAAEPFRVESLAWMSGCWAFTSAGRETHEQWMAPAGGVMLGMSRALRDGRADSIEFVVLRGGEHGVAYEAMPLGQKPTAFPLVKQGAHEAVFENPAHDFPQRIIYRREGDRLLTRIEGTQGGATRGSDYPFVRVPCP